MKLFTRMILLAGAALGMISPVAKADPIVAATSMSGTPQLGGVTASSTPGLYYFTSLGFLTSGSITQANVPNNTAGVTTSNSTVTPYFATGGAVTFAPGPFTIGQAGSSQTISATPTSGGYLFASATGTGGATLQFYITSFTVLSNVATSASGVPGSVTIVGNGYFAETASGKTYTNTAANFTITASTSGASSFTANAVTNVAATPEPSSLILLGTGLVSAACMAFRRRELV